MGIYLNPGTEKFEEAIRSEIFIDKTRMIDYLNSVIDTKQKYVAVSRPRRFGKTIAADMIGAYYDISTDSRSIFADKKLNPEINNDDHKYIPKQQWDLYLNKYNVIHIDMVKFIKGKDNVDDCIELVNKRVTKDIVNAFPDVDFSDVNDLHTSLEEIYAANKTKFVMVIDEWDCVFRKLQNDLEGQKRYLDFLRDLMKDEPYIALAYMTGILPIKKYGEHSALNMFDEYSMIEPAQLAEYVGFTDEEVLQQCKDYGRNFDDLKCWYDGYHLTGVVPPHEVNPQEYHIYSPLSVVNSIRTGTFSNYWNETETGEALKEYIRRNFDGLKEDVAVLMNGGRVSVNVSTYQNDMTTFNSKDDIFTLLIHLGYLGYDSHSKEVFIPNKEVREVFRETTQDQEWNYLFQVLNNSQKLLEATWAGDEAVVAKMVEEAHMRAGNQTYNSEAALSYAVRLAYFNAEEYYTLIPEMQAGKGYADLVYIPSPKYPDKPAILIELKWNKDAESAMSQITDKKYPDALKKYEGNIILVGINYDKEVRPDSEGYKHHSCRIMRG
ncbi:PD-(D/E)XK nuclease superfamily protein [Pseudobutyrivibrio sp. ACV-2]|uniref:AAA family ATPase n=1 Tax=Pseudobutyrivibrio sp. ACV-2 TaxID=1520801 RepID=UPI00089D018C|nr:AAA family ATPase [Pseudobutyrivibrio sp. ACV-2]SEA78297.1 PD-(D/E)XK nuclease superfamily protein [Pseudobutyrivibrio sp. ACV-2]